MIFINATQSLQIVLSGNVVTNQLQFTCSYVGLSSAFFSGSVTDGTTNNTTPVTVIPSDTTSPQTQLKFLSVYNSDSVTQIVTVQYYDGTNTQNIFTAYLQAGWALIYNNDRGFVVYNNYGTEATSSTTTGGTPFTFTLSCADGIWQPQASSSYVLGTRYGIQPEAVSSAYLPSSLLPSSLLGNYFGFYLPASCTIKSVSLSAGYLNQASDSTSAQVSFVKNNTNTYLIDGNVNFAEINYQSNNPMNISCGQGDYITGVVYFGSGEMPTGIYITLLFYCD